MARLVLDESHGAGHRIAVIGERRARGRRRHWQAVHLGEANRHRRHVAGRFEGLAGDRVNHQGAHRQGRRGWQDMV